MPFSSSKTLAAIICFGWALGYAATPSQADPPALLIPSSRAPQASLLIQSSPLAGSQYHALPDVVEQIHVGDALALRREPDNTHDRNAVQILWQGHLLGFVPRRENKAIARALDQNVPLLARVVALRPEETPWRRLRFEISMPLDAPEAGAQKSHIKSNR